MKKLLFSLVLLTICSFSAQAQVDDTLPPWFRVPQMLLEIEDRIDGINSTQLDAIRSAVTPIVNRAKGGKLTQQQKVRIRQQVRKAIVEELTPAQRTQLKATRKNNKDALDRAMLGRKGRRSGQ
ncbi:MAG: hypothetical protein AAF840_10925 [Bacteroidota bacterium]